MKSTINSHSFSRRSMPSTRVSMQVKAATILQVTTVVVAVVLVVVVVLVVAVLLAIVLYTMVPIEMYINHHWYCMAVV